MIGIFHLNGGYGKDYLYDGIGGILNALICRINGLFAIAAGNTDAAGLGRLSNSAVYDRILSFTRKCR